MSRLDLQSAPTDGGVVQLRDGVLHRFKALSGKPEPKPQSTTDSKSLSEEDGPVRAGGEAAWKVTLAKRWPDTLRVRANWMP